MTQTLIKQLLPALALFFAASAAIAECRDGRIDIRHNGTVVSFEIDLANTAETRARGLMFVEAMPQFSGMLFVYDTPQAASFWMRNTLIPLDMLFADKDGVVRQIHQNAIPHDETPIFGGDAVLAVLEINGGMSAILRLEEGAEMRHPAFGAQAAWPCTQ